MKAFMDQDFLLNSEPAKQLYHNYAASMPIIDYHCHVSPQHIAQDMRYTSITDVWLAGDHYKWRLMRANGVPEAEITGSLQDDPYCTFFRFAETLPKAIGNPVYHWTHLELKRYFGVSQQLNANTAPQIYEHCNQVLAREDMSVRGIIARSNVELIGTTDDPTDSLEWHQHIQNDPSCKVRVVPSFRPDKALNPAMADYTQYIQTLSTCSGIEIKCYADLVTALYQRVDYFDRLGCKTADHALEGIIYAPADQQQLNRIFEKAQQQQPISTTELQQLRTALLLALAQKYHALGWVMQIHFGCLRNNNTLAFSELGADTGFDAIKSSNSTECLAPLLDRMNSDHILPRMVFYSLNQQDNEAIIAIAGCFMKDAVCPGQLQLGSAWWLNDTKAGIEKQLKDVANGGLLGNCIGMLTDSRSFLSYTRHEYFRRILCNLVGEWVHSGEYGADAQDAGQIIQDICYYNTKRLFGF